jgi:hypothetical protein
MVAKEKEMITDRRAGYITVILEEEDFQKIDWRSFLEDLKTMIPQCDREYDGVLKVWTIVDCPYNEQVLNELYAKYFRTKEQLEML